jgi:hypothetical protein
MGGSLPAADRTPSVRPQLAEAKSAESLDEHVELLDFALRAHTYALIRDNAP